MLRLFRDVMVVLVVTCVLMTMVVTEQENDEYDTDQSETEDGYGSGTCITILYSSPLRFRRYTYRPTLLKYLSMQ